MKKITRIAAAPRPGLVMSVTRVSQGVLNYNNRRMHVITF